MRGSSVAYDPRLGKVPDSVLAREYGVTRQCVSHNRRLRRIAAFRAEDHSDQALAEAVLRAVPSRFEPRTRQEIHHAVLNDYGTVSLHRVETVLGELVEEGKIIVEVEEEIDGRITSYRRKG